MDGRPSTSTQHVVEKLQSFKYDLPFRVKPCGSTTRNTNVDGSDIDINLELGIPPLSNFQCFPENNALLLSTNPKYSIPTTRKYAIDFAKYKKEVFKFKLSLFHWLSEFKEFTVKNSSTVIKLVYLGESYDLAPCLLYDFHGEGWVLTGTALVRPGGGLTLNFNEALRKGVEAREAETDGTFNKLVKAMKGHTEDCVVKVPSFGLESLLLTLPRDVLAERREAARAVVYVAAYILENTLSKYETLFCPDDIVRISSILPETHAEAFLKFVLKGSFSSKL